MAQTVVYSQYKVLLQLTEQCGYMHISNSSTNTIHIREEIFSKNRISPFFVLFSSGCHGNLVIAMELLIA